MGIGQELKGVARYINMYVASSIQEVVNMLNNSLGCKPSYSKLGFLQEELEAHFHFKDTHTCTK